LAEVFFDMTMAGSIKEGGVTGSVGVKLNNLII
jgi:hypothetical protein